MATGVDDQVSKQTKPAGSEPGRTIPGSAVLFADFQDCMPMVQSDATQGRTQKLAAGANELTDRIVRTHQGQIIKEMGHSLLAEFYNPASAARAAIEILRLHAASGGDDDSAGGPRVGIHLADAGGMLEGFGRAVHVAAGITKHAARAQILVSSEIRDAICTEADLACQRSQTLSFDDGVTRREIYEIQWSEVNVCIPARYEVLSRVGTGGMGIVYKVRDREINDIIALKILKSGIADDPAMQGNFRREVSLARKVTHKNVCRIHEFNRAGSMAYVSMEFIEGESLLSKLRSGPLAWNEALQIAQQICSGLREAHLQGIVHRDLKPANIMVDGSGTVKITDFGIARVFQGTGQMTGTLVGTPAYMAPEQVELKRIDARTDIYALGLLLYEMVTAAPAFHGNTPIAVAVKQLREFPKRPRLITPTLPPHAEAIILKCLHKDPAKRFQSVDELTLALGTPPQARHIAPARRPIGKQLARIPGALREQMKAVTEAGYRFAEGRNWRQMWSERFATKRARPALLAALGTLCMLSGVLAVAPRLRSKTPSPSATSPKTPVMQMAIIPAGGASSDLDEPAGAVPALRDSAPDVIRPVNGYTVDLAYSEISNQKAPEPAAAKPAPKIAPKIPKRATAAGEHKVQPAVIDSITTPDAIPAQADPSQLAASLVATPAKPDSTEAAKLSSLASNPSGSAASIDTPDTSEKSKEVEGTKEDSPQTAQYFSVGSFKDATWADEAVGKLVQLGFPAIAVRKKTLWIQSYEVRVGPYEHPDDFDAAGTQLREFGFKPHAVK